MLELNWSLQEIAAALEGELKASAPLVPGQIRLIQTDSRQVNPGDLFICLIGERYDAHEFAEQVAEAGAIALVTDRLLESPLPQFVVKDTRLALGVLATAWRQRFELKVLGVVGSNGKTTTKEMLGSICKAQWGDDHVLVTAGNLNNDIGVPQTLLKLRGKHRAAVVEMGMNHPGEIDYLAGLVKPHVVVLTNAQREHQEFMKTVEAVAEENGAAFTHLSEGGTAVFPASEAFQHIWEKQAGNARCLSFGPGTEFELLTSNTAENSPYATVKVAGQQALLSPSFIGEHNNVNAAGAAAAAHAAGCSMGAIQKGLENFQPVSGRLQVVLRSSSFLLINDTYNANPDSVNAASQVLVSQPGNTLLILGDMGEVGDQSDAYHAEVGQFAKQAGVNRLFALGEATLHSVKAFGEGAVHFSNIETLIEKTMNTTKQGCWTVLVKGSRFMKMERVVHALLEQHVQEANNAS